jgi:hypothetical protein
MEHDPCERCGQIKRNLVTPNLESSCSAPNILTTEGVYRHLVFAILEGIERRLDKPCHLGLVLDQ